MSPNRPTPPEGTPIHRAHAPYDPEPPAPRTGNPVLDAILKCVTENRDAAHVTNERLSRLEHELAQSKLTTERIEQELVHAVSMMQAHVLQRHCDTVPAPGPEEPPHPARPAIVLVVEDEQMLQAAIKRVLSTKGMKTVSALSAAAACAILEDPDVHVDVVLVDLRLQGGGVGGLEFASHVQRTYPETPILLMSGLLTEEDRTIAEALHLRVLLKPFSHDEIVDAIREAHGAHEKPT